MPMQFVFDIHHYLNEYGELPDGLPKQALKMASYFAQLRAKTFCS